MGRRKRWKLDLLSGEAAALLLLGAAFLLGGAAGCAASGAVAGEGLEALEEYLRGYLELAVRDAVRPPLWSTVWEVIRFPLAAAVLGFTALGVVGLPVLFGVRGFLLCYAAASFYRVFGLAGEVPAFILFGLPALIWLPVLFQLGVQGLLASYALLRRALGEGRYPLRYGRRYLARCGVCALALAGCAAVEYFAVPVLLAAVGA